MKRVIFFFILVFQLVILKNGLGQTFFYYSDKPADIDVDFSRHTVESRAGSTFFNVVKLKNNSSRSETVKLNITVPEGWNIIGSQVQELTIQPFDSLLVPIRVGISSQVKGDIGYSVIASITDSRGNTIKNEYSFVKIPRVSSLDIGVQSKIVFINKSAQKEFFSIKVINNGNKQELINFLFDVDNSLLLESNGNEISNYELSIDAYKDTLIDFYVRIKDIDAIEYLSMAKINYSATSLDKVYNETVWFRILNNNFSKVIPQSERPLVLDFSAQGLFNESYSPKYVLVAEGKILFSKNREIGYSYRNYNSKTIEDFYLNNRMFVDFRDEKWNIRLGDITNNIENSMYGRGASVQFSIPSTSHLAVFSKNEKLKSRNIGYSATYNPTSKLSLMASAATSDIRNKKEESYVGSLGFRLKLKNQAIIIQQAISKIDYKFDSLQVKYGFGIFASYSIKLNKFHVNAKSHFGSPEYSGTYRGRLYAYITGDYTFNEKNFLIINYNNYRTNPSIYKNETLSPTIFNYNQKLNATHNFTYNPRNVLVFGIEFTQSSSNNFAAIEKSEMFSSISGLARIGFKFRIPDPYLIFSPSFSYGLGKVYEYPTFLWGEQFNVNEENEIYNFQILNASLRSKSWGFLVTYENGPFSIFDQFSFLYSGNNRRILRASPYFNDFIFKQKLELNLMTTISSNINDNNTYANINSKLIYYFNSDFTAYFQSVFGTQSKRFPGSEVSVKYSSVYFEAGLKNAFGIQQPREKIRDLNLVFFLDFNGNLVKDENEPGLRNVIVSVEKVLEKVRETDENSYEYVANELISSSTGLVSYKNLTQGLYNVNYYAVGREAGNFTKVNSELVITLDKNKTEYIPFVEKNKVFGKVILNRSKLSGLGKIDLSNVRITATDSRGRSFTTLTDKNGEFILFAPVTDEYILTVNNIFYENFDLRQNNFIVQFNGYKQFEVNFVFDEKVRRINFAATPEGEGVTGVQQVRRTNISGTVKDANSQKPVRARINLVNTRTNSIINSTNSSATSGDYTMSFMASENYLLEVVADDYWYLSENLILNQVTTFMNITRDVMLRPISVGSKVELNIRFDVNSSFLAPESVAELNRLLRIVRQNTTVRLEIQGHCDDLEALQRPEIAIDRAKAVAKYLVENGFSNVEVRSLGNTVPIASNDTEEGRTRNRRVEVEVLSK